MKVLIWIGCLFVATILNTLLGYTTGIKAGYLVFYFAVYFVAEKICNKWDKHKEAKEIKIKATTSTKVNIAEANDICFCRKCGEKLLDRSQFCSKCGTKIVKE